MTKDSRIPEVKGLGASKSPARNILHLFYDSLTIFTRYLIFNNKNRLLSELEMFVKFRFIIFL
jgi:hypothetical protein